MNVDVDVSKWKLSKSFKKDILNFKKDQGMVVTRFPPAPNGHMHIGHAKALFINYIVAAIGEGKMLIRIDDTNPSSDEELYTISILDDIDEMLNGMIHFFRLSYTSDHFGTIMTYADQLVTSGDAYVDGTDPNVIVFYRNNKMQSPYANNSIEQNMFLWNKMKTGELTGAILRLKLDFSSSNGCMRDPTIYRFIDKPHSRTNSIYKVYPTYDFACPIVDSIEGVTHVFRSTEFTDRNLQYTSILAKLNLRAPILNQYGKLCFKDAVLSKRKIKSLITNGTLSGWNDPTLLTWKGAKRRGLSREGLIEFLAKIGNTKSVVDMEQHTLWSINQKVIDKVSTRLIGLNSSDNIIDVSISDFIDIHSKDIPRFHRNCDLGTRNVYYDNNVFMYLSDVESLNIGEEVTLMNWGNVIYTGNKTFKLNLDGDITKTTKKLQWIAKKYSVRVKITHIFNENESFNTKTNIFHVEKEIETLKKGDYVQIMTKGYYKIDECDANSTISLIELPKL